jgi:uncharacterized protein YabN with tetrapyrrole methylase and pyrophosphatase domain
VEALLQTDAPKERLAEEIGDLLFAAVNVARLAGVHAEDALRDAVRKFVRRFQAIETLARKQGKDLSQMSLAEMDALWEETKRDEGREMKGE